MATKKIQISHIQRIADGQTVGQIFVVDERMGRISTPKLFGFKLYLIFTLLLFSVWQGGRGHWTVNFIGTQSL